MPTPEQIFLVYQGLAEHAATIKEFQIAKGEPVSGTVQLLLAGKRAKFLHRWAEEMAELAGVLYGTHDDPYIVEATQCFYWASLFAVSGGVGWSELGFADLRQQAVSQPSLAEAGMVLSQSQRLAELEPEQVKPAKLFLLWWAMDDIYRHTPRFTKKGCWSVEELMQYDLQDMKKRSYLEPILRELELL